MTARAEVQILQQERLELVHVYYGYTSQSTKRKQTAEAIRDIDNAIDILDPWGRLRD